jgi:hypothetical protein
MVIRQIRYAWSSILNSLEKNIGYVHDLDLDAKLVKTCLCIFGY